MDHPLLTNEWNSLDSPAEDAVLVAHPNVQMFVLLFDCSTVSQEWNRQEIAFAHSDGSQDGQNRALTRFAHFLPFHVIKTSGGMDQL